MDPKGRLQGSCRLMSKGIISWIKCALCQPSWTNNSAKIAQVMSHGVQEGESQGQKWKVMGEAASPDPRNLMGHCLMKVWWGPLIIHLWLAHLKSALRSQGWQGENECVYLPCTFQSRFIKNVLFFQILYKMYDFPPNYLLVIFMNTVKLLGYFYFINGKNLCWWYEIEGHPCR